MSPLLTAAIIVLLALGTLFIVVGTLGLLRFPDLATRLHAVAKADNLGLGFIAAALVVHALAEEQSGWGIALKLLLIWLLALLGTAANSHLLARPPDEEHPEEKHAEDAASPAGQETPLEASPPPGEQEHETAPPEDKDERR